MPGYALAAFLLLLVPPSQATELYGPSEAAAGPELRVQLFADDGFTRVTALDAAVMPGVMLGAEGAAQVLGTLDPTWHLETIHLVWGSLAFSGTVGATAIPWELDIDPSQALNIATGTSPFLTPEGIQLFPGGSEALTGIRDAGVQGRVTGSLLAQGEGFGFDTGEVLLCDACVSGTLSATPAAGMLASFGIASGEFAPLLSQDFAQGGLTWTVKVFSHVGGAEMTLVPEPSTASLVMLGLAGLALRRARTG